MRRRARLTAENATRLLELVETPIMPGVSGVPRTRFAIAQCDHCQGVHTGKCPAVAEIAYYQDGRVKKVRYWQKWDHKRVIFLDDVYEAAGEDTP